MKNLLLVFVGGGFGSLARYGVSLITKVFFNTAFPLATLISNITSCLILALVVLITSQKQIESNSLKLLLIAGFCGGFSTFSTFSFETVELFRNGNTGYAIANIAISIILCVGLIHFISKAA